jgi:hypothetical protein
MVYLSGRQKATNERASPLAFGLVIGVTPDAIALAIQAPLDECEHRFSLEVIDLGKEAQS